MFLCVFVIYVRYFLLVSLYSMNKLYNNNEILIMFYRLLLIIIPLCFSGAAYAESFFNKVLTNEPGEMGYKYVSLTFVDNRTFDSGISFYGSFPLANNVVVDTYYEALSDITVIGVGGLLHQTTGLIDDADINLAAGFRRYSYDAGGSDSGLVASLGVRKEMNPDFELNTKATLAFVDDTDLEVEVGAVYEITNALHLDGKVTFADTDKLNIGIRYYLD